jgi:PIN domain nuclease of toxin-antitoxin system
MAVPLLLDTHCWYWMRLSQVEEFSQESVALIREAAEADELLVSVISVWEIAMLESKKRIALEIPLYEWVERALDTPGLSLAPLTPEIAIESTRLPGDLRGDPADLILVATARRMGARLMTRDRNLLVYGRQKHVKILSA